jgi:hypothetical protein
VSAAATQDDRGLVVRAEVGLGDLKGTAEVFIASGLFKADKKATTEMKMAQAMVKIMAGREIGLGPFASMSGFDIIDGKCEASANTQALLIKRHPRYDYRIVKHTDDECVLRFFQDGEPVGDSVFTMKHAVAANLHRSWDYETKGWKDKKVWKQFPRNMLFARALTNGAAWYCPDAVDVRLYGQGEIGGPDPEFDQDGTLGTDPSSPASPAGGGSPRSAPGVLADPSLHLAEDGRVVRDGEPIDTDQVVDEASVVESDSPTHTEEASAVDDASATDIAPEPEPDAEGAPAEAPAQDFSGEFATPLLTFPQMKRIRQLQAHLGWNDEEIRDFSGVESMKDVTREAAPGLIKQLEELTEGPPTDEPPEAS